MRAPYLDDGDVRLYLGDCIEVLAEMDAESVDAVVCDPPYGIGFMGKEWDVVKGDPRSWAGMGGPTGERHTGGNGSRTPGGAMIAGEYDLSPRAMHGFSAWCESWAREALRVLKPGGHLLAFGGTRTYHRLTCGIEDAGFEVRDCLSWLYGSGFPKSLDVSKAIDKAAGAERVRVGNGASSCPGLAAGGECDCAERYGDERSMSGGTVHAPATAPATDAAREWQGWGTALKPGHEPAVVARKPHTPQTELAAEAARAQEELCAVVSYAATVTSWSELLRTSGISSIASSLRECLADLSSRASTFTTETASSLTTDLAIWRSSLSPIMLASITRAPTPEPGAISAANTAAALSASVLAKHERLAATTAGETAIARPAVPGLTPGSGLDNPSPAWEPCVVARKPLAGTVAENVQAHGTGAINVDGCRIAGDVPSVPQPSLNSPTGLVYGYKTGEGRNGEMSAAPGGRWPANVVLDEQAAAMLDAQSGERGAVAPASGPTHNGPSDRGSMAGPFGGMGDRAPQFHGDTGGASRFFYTAKASRADRSTNGAANNTHPTVKPTDLMRWLVRLVTPPGGVVLDPFAGSGSTLVAARAEGFRAIGIEREHEYAEIIAQRLSQLSLFSEAS